MNKDSGKIPVNKLIYCMLLVAAKLPTIYDL